MFRIVIAALVSFSLVSATPAAWGASRTGKDAELSTPGPRKHLTTIVFAGLAGAILGLSTLSFYGRPQDKLNNIAVGAAIGIIGGTIYTTFKAATEPREFYNLRDFHESESLAMLNSNTRPEPYTPRLQLSFDF